MPIILCAIKLTRIGAVPVKKVSDTTSERVMAVIAAPDKKERGSCD
jgi:hypothetical protein